MKYLCEASVSPYFPVVSRAIRIAVRTLEARASWGRAQGKRGRGKNTYGVKGQVFVASRPGLLPPQSITIHTRMLRTLITRGCFSEGERPGRFSHVMLGTTTYNDVDPTTWDGRTVARLLRITKRTDGIDDKGEMVSEARQ